MSKKNHIPNNVFYDINKFPAEKGVLVFPISISRIQTGQNSQKCLEYIRYFSPEKISTPTVGLNFIYGDLLYMNSNEPAFKLKHSFMHEISQHKNRMEKLLHKDRMDFQIQHAFAFQSWGQVYLDSENFTDNFTRIREIYISDEKFQKYLKEDAEHLDRPVDDLQTEFFLEEYLMSYLTSKGKTRLRNDYIQDQQKWILFCYPGSPLKAHIYLYQLNPFNLDNEENPYQNAWYDLEAKKLIDFDRVDLDTYDYKYEEPK